MPDEPPHGGIVRVSPGSDDPIVLSRKAVRERNASINERYGVAPDRWLAGPEDDGAVEAPK